MEILTSIIQKKDLLPENNLRIDILGVYNNKHQIAKIKNNFETNQKDLSLFSCCTRVIAYHLGVNGYFSSHLSYSSLLSFSRNYGLNSTPFSSGKQQFSCWFEMQYELSAGWLIKSAMAADTGQLFNRGISLMLSVAKTGLF